MAVTPILTLPLLYAILPAAHKHKLKRCLTAGIRLHWIFGAGRSGGLLRRGAVWRRQVVRRLPRTFRSEADT